MLLPTLLALLASMPLADTLRYAIRIQGTSAGQETVIRQGPTRTISFDFNDRGRGPRTVTRITVDRAQLPTSVTITGNDYLKQPVDERLTIAAGVRRWTSSGERGSSRSAGFYLPLQAPPDIAAQLIRAGLTAGGTVALLPSGRATIEKLASRTVTGTGPGQTVTLYAISGLGFLPDYHWLDGDLELFASLSGWQRTVRQGWESVGDDLAAAQDSIGRARASAMARTLADRPTGPVAFVNATVFDPKGERLVPGQTVLVDGNTIQAVGPSATMRLTARVRLIDLRGRTLLPGLWDMHAHLSEVDGPLDIAAGVTSVRDMANDVDYLLAARKSFEDGSAIGPRVVMAGFIDGPGPYAGPTKALVSTVAQANEWVDRYASLGYEQIKLYSSLDTGLVRPIAERAHGRGMRLSGHIPRGMLAAGAVRAGYDEIQHTNMLFLNFLGDTLDTRTPMRFIAVARHGADLDLQSDSVRAFLRFLADRGTVVDPTVATFEGMFTASPTSITPGDRAYASRLPAQVRRGLVGGGLPADSATRVRYRASYRQMLAMVKALYDTGIPIVAGTDCLAGFCLHRELELYVEAGIPPAAVLRIATLGAATVARRSDRLGTIEPGKLADLIVVAGNPVARIRDIRKVTMVMKDGVLYDPAAVYRTLGVAPAVPQRKSGGT